MKDELKEVFELADDLRSKVKKIIKKSKVAITWQSQRGSELTAARCNCCGVQSSVSHVKPKSFVFVAPAEADHE